MKRLLKELLPVILRSKVLTTLLRIIMNVAGRKNVHGRLNKLKAEHNFFEHFNYPKIVMNGPFKGMKYPTLVSHCSDMAPKIIGSYERELHSLIEEIYNDTNYSSVIDIGCAEGYYAVGLLRKMPTITMYAYDIDAMSRKFCNDMAVMNDVNDRLVIRELCSAKTLGELNLSSKSLIICDCEGYEIELFTKENINNLTSCNILIELHDLFDPRITPTLIPLFDNTHNVEIFISEDRNMLNYPELSCFDEATGNEILSESREGLQQWAFFRAKKFSV